MWLRYWMLILLALVIAVISYAFNHPAVGWKVRAIADIFWSEIMSLIEQIWAIISGLLKGR